MVANTPALVGTLLGMVPGLPTVVAGMAGEVGDATTPVDRANFARFFLVPGKTAFPPAQAVWSLKR